MTPRRRWEPFWELFAGMGLFGLLLGALALDPGVVVVGILILVVSVIHWGRR